VTLNNRIFIGINLNAVTRQEVEHQVTPLKNQLKNVRWVPPENLHLTLAFIGVVEQHQYDNLIEQFPMFYIANKTSCWHLDKLQRFPNHKGHIIAATGEYSQHLEYLSQLTRNGLHRLGIHFDTKDFRPHITLGRIKRKPLKDFEDSPLSIDMPIREINLYNSVTSEDGARYHLLSSTSLS
jgi:2'-5' RNA ligase